MGDVNLEIKLSNLDERVIKIEETGGGSGGDGYITSVSNDFNVVNKKLSLSNNVTTKLSKVDTPDNLSVELAKKIDKPASATDGQVLTYNATSSEWEAGDSQGNTDIISDEWASGGTYAIGDYVIDSNVLYKCIGDGGGDNRPSEDTGQTIWQSTSVSEELPKIKTITFSQTTDANGNTVIWTDSTCSERVDPSKTIVLSVGGTIASNGYGFFTIVSPRINDYLVRAIAATQSQYSILANTLINWKVIVMEL